MKQSKNLIYGALFFCCFMSACARPVDEKAYVYPPPPPIYSRAELIAQQEEQARIAERLAQEKERKRQAEEAARTALEEEKNRQIRFEQERLATTLKIQDSIDTIKSSIEAGSCSKADRQAHELMDFISSAGNRLEADLLTAVCLCHLEKDGDVSRFTRCGSELQKATKGHQYIEKEAQLVLLLLPYFNRQTKNQRDPRIDMVLEHGVQSTLTSK